MAGRKATKQPTGNITALGRRVTKFTRLETFPRPEGLTEVELTSNECGALCPVTSAPDFYSVTINYKPDKLCCESKTVKIFLQSFRNKGIFCEAFATEIAQKFANALDVPVNVTVVQTPRGGVGITAKARRVPSKGK